MSEADPFPRKRFIINPSYQWKHATFMILCLLPLSALYPIVIINIFDYFISRTAQGAVVDAGLLAFRSGVIVRLVMLQISFLILVALVSLYISHRTAGPIHKLVNAMRELREGRFKSPLFFRKRDFFSEVAVEFNLTFEQLTKTHQALAQIEEKLSKADPKLKSEIEEILKSLRAQ
jgi:methyl-accepting chemotaxis protein